MRLSPVAPSLSPESQWNYEPNDVENAIRKEKGSLGHYPNGAMVCVENTSNRGGGTVYPQSHLDSICGIAKTKQCSSHLDGARIFNAAVASGTPLDRMVRGFRFSLCMPVQGAWSASRIRIAVLRGDNQSCSQMEEDVWWRHAPSGYHCRSRDLCH